MPKFLAVCSLLIALLACVSGVARAAGDDAPRIVVNIPSRTLTLFYGQRAFKTYEVGIGRADNQTPIGSFQILYKEENPTWVKPVKADEEEVVIPSGPDNPLGYRWMEFDGLYGIHGTNNPHSVGEYVSNGCVRMYEPDVEEVYARAPVGTPVEVTYERVVLRKIPGKMVTLAIYPDAYGLQPLTLAAVQKKLRAYGADGAVSSAALQQLLDRSDGKPLALNQTFAMAVRGKPLPGNGIFLEDTPYLPAVIVATEMKMDIHWDPRSQRITTPYGSVSGYVQNDILYFDAKQLYDFCRLYASWQPKNNLMHMDTCPE